MDDLISRAEAIEEIEFGITDMKAINMETGEVIEPFAKINAELREAVNRVKELPSAQPEPKWIPCSIKLPKKTGLYYVTIRDEKNDIEYTSCMNFYVNLARWEVDVNVIAWMPEPEPYKEEE